MSKITLRSSLMAVMEKKKKLISKFPVARKFPRVNSEVKPAHLDDDIVTVSQLIQLIKN